jgi:hypothetical protein
MWVATATEIAAGTEEARVGVLVRPFGESRCMAAWDFEANTLDMAYMSGSVIVAGASTRGELYIYEFDEDTPLMPVAWPISPGRSFGRAIAWGGYHEVTNRSDWPRKTTLPFRNCTIVTDAGAVEDTDGLNIIVHAGNLHEVTRPNQVVGFYEGSENSDPEAINRYCRDIRAAWVKRFPGQPIPPVLCYLQPRQVEVMAGRYPQEVDIFSPQIYFEANESPVRIDFFRWMEWWKRLLPTDRLWAPTIQTYDRNFQWGATQMSALTGQMGQLISLVRAYPFIAGYMCFSVNRPGGIERWPELREALARVATIGGVNTFPSRWAFRSAPEPKPEPQPEPKPEIPMPVHLSDPELTLLAQRLERKYSAAPDEGGLGRGPTTTYVDPLGASRWRWDYINLRNEGKTPDQAWAQVNRTINGIAGLPGDVDPNPQ